MHCLDRSLRSTAHIDAPYLGRLFEGDNSVRECPREPHDPPTIGVGGLPLFASSRGENTSDQTEEAKLPIIDWIGNDALNQSPEVDFAQVWEAMDKTLAYVEKLQGFEKFDANGLEELQKAICERWKLEPEQYRNSPNFVERLEWAYYQALPVVVQTR
jgi:hypothetical protein